MQSKSTIALGKIGEDIASAFLERNGYTIIERNFRYLKSEIDIICTDNRDIIFVEVKLRSDGMLEFPEAAVGRAKQRNIRIAADYFMHENEYTQQARFDIIAVVYNGSYLIEHFIDAFYPFDTY